MLKTYTQLTKFGIVVFVLLSGLAGYLLSFPIGTEFDIKSFLTFFAGMYFISSGSLALNQVQEWEKDQMMPRTASRPIAAGRIKPAAAGILSFIFIAVGAELLFEVSVISAAIGLLIVALYNGFYVYKWKPEWAFGAIPGALPGALPVTMGYAAHTNNIWSPISVYIFLILFIWQMPHFWCLAIRFKDDYSKAGFPVLPAIHGIEKTLYHIRVWVVIYILTAIASVALFQNFWIHIILVLPFSFFVLKYFIRFHKANAQQGWLGFFLWTNFSVLAFLFAPVLDKWIPVASSLLHF